MVLTTPHRRAAGERLAGEPGALAAGVFAEAAMHTPVEGTERAAMAAAGARTGTCARNAEGHPNLLAAAWRGDPPAS
jgi:maleylacetate reductase